MAYVLAALCAPLAVAVWQLGRTYRMRLALKDRRERDSMAFEAALKAAAARVAEADALKASLERRLVDLENRIGLLRRAG